MTGQEVLKQAIRLLGYTDTLGEPDGAQHTESYKRSLAIVEQLTADLSMAEQGTPAPPLASMRQELPLSERTARDVLPYGVAMLLAAAQGDGDNQQLFAALYDQKRASCQRRLERRCDVLPRGEDA